MTIRTVAFAVIAALLLTGGAVTAAQTPATEPVSTAQNMASQAATLTAQEAEAAALAHAGLTAAQVTNLYSHQDRDNGILEWDVEFRCGDYEFDYDIHAETGEVLHWDKDYEPLAPPISTEPPVTEPAEAPKPAPTEPPAAEQPKTLTAAEAKAIALAHAGLSADAVSRLRAEFDYDDGVPEWEVEFVSGGWEYEYDIHAESGAIRSAEKDRDD